MWVAARNPSPVLCASPLPSLLLTVADCNGLTPEDRARYTQPAIHFFLQKLYTLWPEYKRTRSCGCSKYSHPHPTLRYPFFLQAG